MNIRESISLAFSSLRTNKMRSFLTLLGIIVGISSVIAILTLGHALKVQTTQSIVSSGANDLMVQVTERPKEGEEDKSASNDPYAAMYGGGGAAPDEASKLDVDDIQRIKDAMGDKISGVPVGNAYGGMSVTLANGERSQSTSISPVNLDFLELEKINITYGRNITQTDIDNRRPVLLLSESQMRALFDSPEDAIGGEVELDAQGSTSSAVVVGVFAPSTSGGLLLPSPDGIAYTPYTNSGALGYKEESWASLTVRPAEGQDLMQVKSQLQAVLTGMYRSNENFQAEIQDFQASTDAFNQILDGISAAISAIAGISLLVGGIGVMNIMLVTVTERTREIGVRKALGATRGAIRLQFVVEAMIVCLVGGVIGVLLGGALGMFGSTFFSEMTFPPLSAVLLALGFSLGIGLFFGYYPANKAAKLDPIDALRYE